ncbi:MAG: tRNA pseudouridine(13) synthase TruD, partial [Pseudomonadota bacterium]
MLDLPRAHAGPVAAGRFRVSPDEFEVSESLKEAPSGAGEHTLLRVEKVGQNTAWVARWLAEAAGCRDRDVGYCGLKDRHARTVQWFSVPVALEQDTVAAPEGVRVLDCVRHHRKLRLGAHSANHFHIRLHVDGELAPLIERCERVRVSGCPNWFGAQRFGRGGANLARARSWFARGGRARPDQRRHWLSAARAEVFNRYLEDRVTQSTWSEALPGDILNLDGSGSLFLCEALDPSIVERVGAWDVHPTGPLWGRGEAVRGSDHAQRERAQLTAHG